MEVLKDWVISMQKMKKGNIIIEVEEHDIEKAKQMGFEVYNGYLLPNAEVDFKD